MASIANAIQKGVYQALTTGSPSPVSAQVYDFTPQNSSFPYVVLESMEVVGDDHLTEKLDQEFLYISVWSRQRGKKEVQTIMGQIYDALHRARLTLETGSFVDCLVVRQRAVQDMDGVSFQGSMAIQIRVAH